MDTNVLFSAVLNPSGTPARLVSSRSIDPVVSGLVLNEFARTVARKAPQLGPAARAYLELLSPEVVSEASDEAISFWRDLEFGTDAPVIAAAVAAEVDALCTGDRRLLRRLPEVKPSLEVISPSDLLARLSL
ncbi:MAG TPA: PIN domain-containing protein [Dehalococcoidia bacterium]|nr:PIN domain-containing protein [Dehalococcoidia bacterium]